MRQVQPTLNAAGLFEIGPSSLAILDAVRRTGAIARSALPEATRLSQQSVHRLSEDLIARGFLRVEPPLITGPGKPSPRLALRPDGAYGLGLAIDTDSLRMVVTNLAGEFLHIEKLSLSPNDPEAVRREGVEAAGRLIRELALPLDRVAGLGIAMQGFRRGSPNAFIPPRPLDAWDSVDVTKFMGPAFAGPVYVENNATLGALAELWAGIGRRYGTFGYLSFNHGLGGGIVLEGTPWHGRHMNAAEISSLYTEEEMARRPALSGLLEILRAEGHELPDIAALRQAYDPGWDGLDLWIRRVTPALRQMIRAFTGLIDPAAIVFGGEAPLDLRKRLIAAASEPRTDSRGRTMPAPDLVASQINEDPSALGAAILPIRRRLFS